MKDRNKLYKVYYGSYLAMITITTILNYVRDAKKKLPRSVEIGIMILDLIILPTFVTAFIYKIKTDREDAKLAKAEAAVVPEMEVAEM